MAVRDLIPSPQFTVAKLTDQQRQYKTTLIDAARLLNQIGWGNQGDIAGIEEDVPIRELWLNPFNPITYTDVEVRQMTASLQTAGQYQAITVAYITNPGTDEEGIPRGHLMITDGHLRFLGACGADWNHLRAVVKTYHSMAEVMLEYTTTKLITRTLTGLERGYLIKQIRYVYDTECRQIAEEGGGEHPMRRAFTQTELAKKWGCSQASISNWEALANQPDAIIAYLVSGKATDDQVLQAIRAEPDDDARRLLALIRLLSANRQPAGTIQLASDKSRQPRPLAFTVDPIPVDSLWSRSIHQETDPMVAFGCLLHDIREVLAVVHKGKRHPALKRLNDAVGAEAITQFIQEVLASFPDAERPQSNY